MIREMEDADGCCCCCIQPPLTPFLISALTRVGFSRLLLADAPVVVVSALTEDDDEDEVEVVSLGKELKSEFSPLQSIT